MSTLAERGHTCGTCYAGRTGSCSSRYKDNAQTDRCVEAWKRQVSAA